MLQILGISGTGKGKPAGNLGSTLPGPCPHLPCRVFFEIDSSSLLKFFWKFMNFAHFFVNSGVFSLGKQARFTNWIFVPECPCEKFMNWPFFGLVCQGDSWQKGDGQKEGDGQKSIVNCRDEGHDWETDFFLLLVLTRRGAASGKNQYLYYRSTGNYYILNYENNFNVTIM